MTKLYASLFASLFLLVPSSAWSQAWDCGAGDRLEPKNQCSYSWTTSATDSNVLDATKCLSVVASFDENTDGSDTSASADLLQCPTSAGTFCNSVLSWTTDTAGQVARPLPGFLKVDVTAATTTGTATVTLSCSDQAGGGHGDGTNCGVGLAARGVDQDGNAQDCFTPSAGSATVLDNTGTDLRWDSGPDAYWLDVNGNGSVDTGERYIVMPTVRVLDATDLTGAVAACGAGDNQVIELMDDTVYDITTSKLALTGGCSIHGQGGGSEIRVSREDTDDTAAIELLADSSEEYHELFSFSLTRYDPTTGDPGGSAQAMIDVNPLNPLGATDTWQRNSVARDLLIDGDIGDSVDLKVFGGNADGVADCITAPAGCAGYGFRIQGSIGLVIDHVKIVNVNHAVYFPTNATSTTTTIANSYLRANAGTAIQIDDRGSGSDGDVVLDNVIMEANRVANINCDEAAGAGFLIRGTNLYMEQNTAVPHVVLDSCVYISSGSRYVGATATNHFRVEGGAPGAKVFSRGDFFGSATTDFYNDSANALISLVNPMDFGAAGFVLGGSNQERILEGHNHWQSTDCSVKPTDSLPGDICIESDEIWANVAGTMTELAVDASKLSTGTIPVGRVGAAHIDLITEIAAALKSGQDGTLITGTAGTSGNCVEFNAQGDLVEAASGAPCGASGGDPILVKGTNVTDSLGLDLVEGADTTTVIGVDIASNTVPTPDTATFTIPLSAFDTVTFGAGAAITWTFDASGGTDPVLSFGNDSVDFNTPVTAVSFEADPVALPSMTFKDSDTGGTPDINAQIQANCPTGTQAGGNEDCDLAFSTQVAGVLTEAFRIDTTDAGVQSLVFTAVSDLAASSTMGGVTLVTTATDVDTQCDDITCDLADDTANLEAPDTDDTQLATTSFVQQEINNADGNGITCASGTCGITADAVNEDELAGTITFASGDIIILPINAVDPTTDGQIRYDSAEEVLEIGDDGVATHKFYPGTRAGSTTDGGGATSLENDALNSLAEVAAAQKLGPDATDDKFVTTDVSPPAGIRCAQIDTDGSLILAADTCAALGPGGSTAIDDLADAGAGDDAVALAEQEQTWTWDTAATAGAFDGLTLQMNHDASSDASTQAILVLDRTEGAGTQALESMLRIDQNEAQAVVNIGIDMNAAGGGITTAFDLSANITNFAVTPSATLTLAEVELLDGGVTFAELTSPGHTHADAANGGDVALATGSTGFTHAPDDNDTSLATTAFVQQEHDDSAGSCTSQFVRAVNANSAPTCATVAAADVAADVATQAELDAVSGTTALTFRVDNDNGGAEPAAGAGFVIEGGSGTDITIVYEAVGNTVDLSGPSGGWDFTEAITASNLSGTNTGDEALSSGSAGLDVSDHVIDLDLAPGTGSATLEQSDDALQVKYLAADFDETANGLELDATVVKTDQANTWTAGAQDMGGVTSFEIPNATGAGAVVDTDGEIGIDLDNNGVATSQFLFDDDAGTRVLSDVYQECKVIQDLADADDDLPLWMNSAYAAVTLVSASCSCIGTCTTEAELILENDDGTPATITNATSPLDCEDTTTGAANEALSGADATIDQYEVVRIDVNAGITPETDDYVVCFNYRIVRQ